MYIINKYMILILLSLKNLLMLINTKLHYTYYILTNSKWFITFVM